MDLARDGEWDKAHNIVQKYNDELSCLIHAYLHRVDGDIGNANYWYRRADTTAPNNTLVEELDRLYGLVKKQTRNPET